MQKRFYLVPAGIVIFILFFTVFGDRGLLRINHLHRDRDEMQQHLQELKGENDRLKREISALQSDRRYLESIARRDFGLVRSNEVIYQFPPQDKQAHPGDKAAAPGAPGAPGDKAADKAAAPGTKAAAPGDKAPGVKAAAHGDKTGAPGGKKAAHGDKTAAPAVKAADPGAKAEKKGTPQPGN